ncbi:MAG TPA: hypothetical protein PK490_17985, partial [Prosthecobacter sp.]|nr:hypothetical protein [Prosthecobacter sp.]HRK16180.1 hypothetical protein [Prosthecobacter sp.]
MPLLQAGGAGGAPGQICGFLPEFARPYLGGGEPVIRRALAYQRGVTLAWREAAVKARPFLAGVF